MAIQPSPEQIERINAQNALDIQKKTEQQAAEGKPFNLPADGHGSGVVPEDTWQELKIAADEAIK